MGPIEIAITERLCHLIRECAAQQYCLELLHFFSRHPFARFSGPVILYSLSASGGRIYVERALGHLVGKGILVRHSDNGNSRMPLYSLTTDQSLRDLVLGMAKLEWRQWQLVLRNTYATVAA